MEKGEIIEEIPGYVGLYQVTNLGSVYRNGKRLKSFINGKYTKVNLYKDGVMTQHTVHRLVATAFIPNPDNKKEVNHKDGNKTNNHVSNLEWVTSSENRQHAYDTGLKTVGEHHRKVAAETCRIHRSKPIIQFTKDNNVVKTWPSAAEAARYTGVGTSCICSCARGIQKSAGGYIWRYAE